MKIKKYLPLSFLVALILWFFREMAFQHKIPFYMDPLTQFYPFAAFTARMFRHGLFPLWNPYSFCGTPFLADIQAAVFHPLNLLYLILPLNIAFSFKLVCQFLAGGIFTYLYLRKIDAGRFASLIGAIIFTFCGSTVTQIRYIPILQATAMIPVIFYLLENAIGRPNFRNISLAAAGYAVMVFSGYPQILHFITILMGLYTACRAGIIRMNTPERPGKALEKLNDAISYLIILVAAAAFFEYYPIFSFRIDQSGYINLLNIIFALLCARFVLQARHARLGAGKLLSAAALFAIVVGAGALLAAVQLLPALEFVKLSAAKSYYPTSMQGVRQPLLYMFFVRPNDLYVGILPLFLATLYCVILLMSGGYGIRASKTPAGNRAHFMLNTFLFTVTALTLYKVPFWFYIFAAVPGARNFESLPYLIPFIGFFAAALTGLSVNGIFQFFKDKGCRLLNNAYLVFSFKSLIFLIVLVQLVIRHPFVNLLLYIDQKKFLDNIESAEFLRKDSSQFRYICYDKGWYSYFFKYKRRINLLLPELGLYYGLCDAQGYDPLQLRRYKDYVGAVNAGTGFKYPLGDDYHFVYVDPESGSRLLDLLNIKYVLSNRTLKSNNFRLISCGGVSIYENRKLLPRAFFVTRYAETASWYYGCAWLSGGLIKPENTVLLDRPESGASASLAKGSPRIDVFSAGYGSGDNSLIYVDGMQVSKNGRGYNIAVIDAVSGRVENSASFDTFDSKSQSGKLAEFIRRIPAGKTVALAVRDEASRNLTAEAVDALRSVGSAIKPGELGFRWAHALVGAKGMAPGKALEKYSAGEASFKSAMPPPVIRATTDRKAGASVVITGYSPDKVTLACECSAPGYLELSDSYYPGWKVFVDGKKEEILRANLVFRAVYLEAGRHNITFSFEPLSFRLGLIISLATLMALAAFIFSGWRGKQVLFKSLE